MAGDKSPFMHESLHSGEIGPSDQGRASVPNHDGFKTSFAVSAPYQCPSVGLVVEDGMQARLAPALLPGPRDSFTIQSLDDFHKPLTAKDGLKH